MKIRAIKTRVFNEGENLPAFILEHLPKVEENSVLAITSKIVSLSEGRTAVNTKQNREDLIKKESDVVVKDSWFSIKDNIIMPAGGIDESNAQGKLIMLPKDSFKSAKIIRQSLKKKLKIKNLGVLITDSNFLPLRSGAIGIALGYAGFRGIRNYIGKEDIFGRKLKYSKTNIPDSLATAAVLCMGEGDEKQPLALITDAPAVFKEKVNTNELRINPKKDMFYPILKNLFYEKKKSKARK